MLSAVCGYLLRKMHPLIKGLAKTHKCEKRKTKTINVSSSGAGTERVSDACVCVRRKNENQSMTVTREQEPGVKNIKLLTLRRRWDLGTCVPALHALGVEGIFNTCDYPRVGVARFHTCPA